MNRRIDGETAHPSGRLACRPVCSCGDCARANRLLTMAGDDGIEPGSRVPRPGFSVEEDRVETMCATAEPRAVSPTRSWIGGLALSGLALIAGLAGPAEAAPRRAAKAPAGGTAVTVDYGVNLAGLPIGTARLAGSFAGSRYQMDVSATLTGLVGAITGGQGSARAVGSVSAHPVPTTFSILSRTSSSSIAVRMAMAGGNVVRSEVIPPLVDTGDRIPITPAVKRNVTDPVSALVMPAHGAASLSDPSNCNRTLPVFDGATRFNVILSYAETRQVQKPGYTGPVLVCAARYQAVAGHRPDRPGVRFMEENRDMSVWLAPVESARVLLPIRISVKTQIGTNIIEAVRWTQVGGTTGDAAPTSSATAQPSLAQASVAAR